MLVPVANKRKVMFGVARVPGDTITDQDWNSVPEWKQRILVDQKIVRLIPRGPGRPKGRRDGKPRKKRSA
jgi:hypothetical protein